MAYVYLYVTVCAQQCLCCDIDRRVLCYDRLLLFSFPFIIIIITRRAAGASFLTVLVALPVVGLLLSVL